jgi:hypothetical protein
MTTQTTEATERIDRPLVRIGDAAPSSTERALVWTGVLLASLAVWTSAAFGTVLLVNGV